MAIDIDISPKKVIYIGQPFKELKHKLRREDNFFFRKYYQFLFVYRPFLIPKSNDLDLGYFKNNSRYKFLNELWELNFNYKKTEFYSSLKVDIKEKSIVKRKHYILKSEDDLNNYCQRFVDLLKSIQRDGYNEEKAPGKVAVFIGPAGELVKESSGRHRLAAAQIVGLEKIPIRITHIHQEWIDSKLPNYKELDSQTFKSKLSNIITDMIQ